MSAVAGVTAGQDILESWGDSVADAINNRASTKTAATGNISTSQTQVVGLSIAANTLQAGQVYLFTASGVCTSNGTNAVTFRIRIGTTTLTGNIAASCAPTASNSASADSFVVQGQLTVRSIGGSGTAIGSLWFVSTTTQPFAVGYRADVSTATVSVDTTTTNLVELTAVTAAAGTTVNFHQASIEALKP